MEQGPTVADAGAGVLRDLGPVDMAPVDGPVSTDTVAPADVALADGVPSADWAASVDGAAPVDGVASTEAAPPADSGPPSSSSVVPGTGKVLAEDLVTDPNPCYIWGAITDPFMMGCDASGASDPFIVRHSGDGDPHVAIGRSAPSSSYRRYISEGGVQSIYDVGVNGTATRTQTEKWSTINNLMSFAPGPYVHYLSFRLQDPSPFPYPVGNGGGITKYSQLLQFKSFGNGGTMIPVVMTIGNDGIKLIVRPSENAPVIEHIIHLTPGTWIRLALVTQWDASGWIEVWGDVNGSGQMVKLVDRISDIDFMNGRTHSALGIGPYHQLSLFDGSVAGQPKQDIYTDYANVQRTEYNGN